MARHRILWNRLQQNLTLASRNPLSRTRGPVIFLSGWSGESTDSLLAMEATHRTDSLVLAFEQALQEKAESAALSEVERDVLAVEALEREVNNGGYRQFFENSSVEFAPTIVDALRRIGCAGTAEITARAVAELGDVAALTPEHIEQLLQDDDEERDERWSACDEAYYGAGEDIAGQLFSYLKRNRASVQLP